MNYKMLILVRNDLKMGKGKIAAQCGHAVLEAYKKALNKTPEAVQEWEMLGQEKVVLKVESKKELLEWFEKLKNLFPIALIKDAGHTQVTPGEPTCVGIGPALESELNKFTKELKLL
ncbi:MAG: peptidyl-tRNA hydrolase [Candidatus Diapherotrites archaeon]|nr:peptidyl-tRNA hydrolase [Candidatus Diapherotrites archaeon]